MFNPDEMSIYFLKESQKKEKSLLQKFSYWTAHPTRITFMFSFHLHGLSYDWK